mmetsp:Transcript_14923/g.34372  ORF Transcript_14923/g.34372 Transcript_14923/m.34372 type:complete len:248 (-) Transcript_14923:584-1327(-)
MVRQDSHWDVREVTVLECLVAEPPRGCLLEALAGAGSKRLVQSPLPPQVMEEERCLPDSLPDPGLDVAVIERTELKLVVPPRLLLCSPPHVLQHALHVHLRILGDRSELFLLSLLVRLLQPSRSLHLCNLQLPFPRPGLRGDYELRRYSILLRDRFGKGIDLPLLPPRLCALLVPPRLYFLPLVVGEQKLRRERCSLAASHHHRRRSFQHRSPQQNFLEGLEVQLDGLGQLLERHLFQLRPTTALGQ